MKTEDYPGIIYTLSVYENMFFFYMYRIPMNLHRQLPLHVTLEMNFIRGDTKMIKLITRPRLFGDEYIAE